MAGRGAGATALPTSRRWLRSPGPASSSVGATEATKGRAMSSEAVNLYDRQWRNTRRRGVAGAQSCAICAKPLDWDAPPRSRWAPSVDHVLPISRTRGLDEDTRRQLALDPS